MDENVKITRNGSRPRYVVFGGGSGLHTLLSGLKHHTDQITAVVTVADDGGSSGRIRKEFDILPPGDIRNCLLALAAAEPLMTDLFNYRFEESDLDGHNFGNLLIAALTRVTGSFLTAIETAHKILSVRGRVLPATLKKVSLVAHHPDGSKSTGEVSIVKSGKPIDRLEIRPNPGRVRSDIAEAIAHADVIIFGPGSLYTSIIPNVLIDGIVEEVQKSSAVKVFVCNIMTQPGETLEYDVQAHVATFLQHAGAEILTHIVVNNAPVPEDSFSRYREEGAGPVVNGTIDIPSLELIEADLVNITDTIRHDAKKLADVMLRLYQKRNG